MDQSDIDRIVRDHRRFLADDGGELARLTGRDLSGSPRYSRVMKRGGSTRDIVWFRGEACYVFHVMNAFEDGGTIVADVMRYDSAPLFPNPDGTKGENAAAYNGVPQNVVSLRLGGIGWTVDRSQDGMNPIVRQTEGPDMYNLENYTNLQITQNDKRSTDEVVAAKLDAKKDLRLGVPAFVKTGFNVKRQQRRRSISEYTPLCLTLA